MYNKVLNRFLKYVSIDTQSDSNSQTFPSTEKQKVLLNLLKDELLGFGIKDVSMDEYGYVMATIPANTKKQIPTIGFIAHVDTSPDMSGKNVNPKLIENYDCKEIILNKKEKIVLSPADFPELLDYKGQTLIVTDGTTLLGADDKAGVAEIMTAVEHIVKNPNIKHGEIKIAFTPDEEIGKGVDFFNVEKFGAKYAYTLDGGGIGELEFENFNAAFAKITIKGRNIHPGYAKDKMINALQIACEFNSLLPVNQRPEFTQDYEGFYHLIQIEGSVEVASMQYIIRDHDMTAFEDKKKKFLLFVDFINKKYSSNIISVEVIDQYYNMRQKIEESYFIVEIAEKAMKELGIKPIIKPIRGGTDGARLSFMGLPCPNIFAGGHNFHGKFEFVPVESMVKATEVILKIVDEFYNYKISK